VVGRRAGGGAGRGLGGQVEVGEDVGDDGGGGDEGEEAGDEPMTRANKSTMSTDQPLTVRAAQDALDGAELVSCLAGSLAYIKEVRDKCLAAGIPAVAAAPAPSRG
jgi:hypothetical protein